MTTQSNGQHTCSMACDERAVAWVYFQGIDIDRDERGCFARPFDWEGDVCADHLADLERDVDAGEAYIYEQIDYNHGTHYSVPLTEGVKA